MKGPPSHWTTLRRLIYLHALLAGSGAETLTVTGVSPLSLLNAVAHSLVSLTQTGKCVQDGTPTPAVPVPILCNNGELKYGVYSKNLFDKNTMDTGQGYYVNTSGNIVNGYNANRTVWIPCKPNTKYSYWHTEGAGGCRAFAMNKDTIDTSDTSEWLKGSPASLGKNVVSTVTTPADAVKLYITAARINLDPERSFDEQLADFMVVEGEVAVASPYEPYKFGLYTVGTPEVLTVSGANLLDPSVVTEENKYISANNGTTTSPSSSGGVFRYSGYIPVKEGTKYYFGMTPYSATTAGIAWYSTTDVTGYISGVSGSTLRNESNNMKATASVGAKYLRFGWRIDEGYDTDWTHSVYVCECDSNSDPIMTAWQPYVTPQTATVPNLFAVGDYADTAEIIHGLLAHKIGIKVLTGEENINTSNACFTIPISDRAASKTELLCSHFPYSNKTSSQTDDQTIISFSSTNIGFRYDACADKTAFAAFLAAEYANGTPVMVFYPLAEETTEQTTPHSLHTVAGTNTVSVVSNVDPVTLEVEYKGLTA